MVVPGIVSCLLTHPLSDRMLQEQSAGVANRSVCFPQKGCAMCVESDMQQRNQSRRRATDKQRIHQRFQG